MNGACSVAANETCFAHEVLLTQREVCLRHDVGWKGSDGIDIIDNIDPVDNIDSCSWPR